jgi:EAL domain-containing protein (putative c-di-GMP-specific phosphodiesterase class I)
MIAERSKVDQIQGYLLGVPLPRGEVYELISLGLTTRRLRNLQPSAFAHRV